MQTKFNVTLVFEKVTIVREKRDYISFAIAKEDHFGNTLSYDTLHEEYEEYYNDRCLRIETPTGNGVNLVRKLGWPGEIEIIDTQTGERSFIANTEHLEGKER